MSKDFMTFLDMLKNSTVTLNLTMERCYKNALKIIKEKPPLPTGCPSFEALIEMELRAVKEKTDEVFGLYQKMNEELFK